MQLAQRVGGLRALTWFFFFMTGKFSLEVLELVGLFLHKGREDLVAVGQRGIV